MTGGLLLVGASGLAREVLAAGLGVVGVLDDDPGLAGRSLSGTPVLGAVAAAVDRPEQLLITIGPSMARQRVVNGLERIGVGPDRYATFIAGSAVVGSTSTVGVGSILLDGVVVTADVEIGSHVVIMPNCTITHDDRLADFATLAAGASLGGGVHIGEAAYVGMNACVYPRCSIGQHSTVGMGAVVIGDLPRDQTWAGVPARRLKGGR